ncbi:phosphotransferase [Kineosporia babensis]|uniref:Aminoglycoside phosphotransferase family protein n=1 Tax=Kineosporia babensis TaxID=499548 RepID=A0A9X1NN14_9ACTN|nr:phosphotransferase [Kineosporia babensis]MCD5316131.1 aminoglycoside phosphotransferase family protein [Kineosporia babensis]
MTRTRHEQGLLADRIRLDEQAVAEAAEILDLHLAGTEAVSLGRTGIYRTLVSTTQMPAPSPPIKALPDGASVAAAHVTRDQDSLTPSAEMHTLVRRLWELGAPVAAPLHDRIVSTRHGDVGFWAWMEHTPLTAAQWGALTGALHRAGRHLHHPRTYEPSRVFQSRLRRARELTSTPGHPLYGAGKLVRSFEAALDTAVDEARRAATIGPFTLVHGDNQPANIMRGHQGLALIDFERTITAPPALDLAGLLLGIQHYAYPPHAAQEFLTGYGPDAPTLDQARPYARIRELSGAVVAMIQSGDNPQMEQQMHIRAVAITNPGQGAPWTYLSPTPTSHLTSEPSRNTEDDCTHVRAAPAPSAPP